MKIIIANAHSIANPGDTAIVLGTIKLLRDINPKSRITIVSRSKMLDHDYYISEGCDVIASFPNAEALYNKSTLKRVLSVPKSLLTFNTLNKHIKSSNLVLLCGGGYYYSNRKYIPGLAFFSNIVPALLAAHHKKPIVSLPQSYGPLRSKIAQYFFRQVLKKSLAIYSREVISVGYIAENYGSYNVSLCPDLAFYLTDHDAVSFPVRTRLGQTVNIGITVRKWGNNKRTYINEIASAVKKIASMYPVRIKIIVQVRGPHEMDDDFDVSLELFKMLKKDLCDVEIYKKEPSFSIDELIKLYSSCDLVLGMRFHSVILAMCAHKPALAIGYQHKSQGILDFLGLSDLYAGSFDNLQADCLCDKVVNLLSNYEKFIKKIDYQTFVNGCPFCSLGTADCDGDSANGCEVNTNTDSNNCGSCGNKCPPGTHCVNGSCVSN